MSIRRFADSAAGWDLGAAAACGSAREDVAAGVAAPPPDRNGVKTRQLVTRPPKEKTAQRRDTNRLWSRSESRLQAAVPCCSGLESVCIPPCSDRRLACRSASQAGRLRLRLRPWPAQHGCGHCQLVRGRSSTLTPFPPEWVCGMGIAPHGEGGLRAALRTLAALPILAQSSEEGNEQVWTGGRESAVLGPPAIPAHLCDEPVCERVLLAGVKHCGIDGYGGPGERCTPAARLAVAAKWGSPESEEPPLLSWRRPQASQPRADSWTGSRERRECAGR